MDYGKGIYKVDLYGSKEIVILNELHIYHTAKTTEILLYFQILCFSVPYVELSVSHTSVLTILAITAERYYAICLPFRSKAEPCTETQAIFTCLICWLLAFGLTAPILAMTEYQSSSESGDPSCSTNVDSFWQKMYFIIIITVFFFIPLVLLIGLYRNIARHLVPQEEQVRILQQNMGLFLTKNCKIYCYFTAGN